MADSDTEPLPRDEAFDILSNRRRRYALYYLSSEGDGITLQSLAREIAAWENEVPPESLSKKQEKRVYVSLYQTHIPKLASAGIVEYDDETGVITLRDRARDVTPYLRAGRRDYTDRWYRYYLALVVASTVLFSLTALEVSVFGAIPLTVVGFLIILAFGGLTVGYVVVRARSDAAPVDDLR